MLNEYSFDNIYIRHAIDDTPDDKDFTMHIHEHCEIYFLVSGNVEYLVEGSKYPLDENSLMIMRPAEAHKPQIKSNEKYERYAVNFPVSFGEIIDPESRLISAFTERPLGKNNMFSASEIDMALIHRLFQEMCCDVGEYERRVTIKSRLLMLLDMIKYAAERRELADNKPESTAERIVLYVNNHLYDDISVPALSRRFYLSPSQFSRVFRQATGASPWDYIIKKRLTAAKELISSGQSARNASESCGFKDYSSFYRAYLKHFGCTPVSDNNKNGGR